MSRRSLVLLLLSLAVPLVPAQTPEPSSRVQREASNPMRMIIEAAKIRPRAKPPEREKVAARPAAAAADLPETTPAAPLAAASAPAEPARPPEQEKEARVAEAPAPAPAASEPAPPRTPESQVTTVEVEAPARPAPVPVAPPPPPEPDPLPPLQLASMVEPITPRGLIGVLRGDVRTHVAFTVDPDGSVRDVAVRSSTHPRMDAAVLEAVRQWRYEPIAAPRPHEVMVVLRPD
ncbi:MAG: TonB family protein [Piscinibacter sp.]|nr:TonB family protein [Piscinibacter sp.]